MCRETRLVDWSKWTREASAPAALHPARNRGGSRSKMACPPRPAGRTSHDFAIVAAIAGIRRPAATGDMRAKGGGSAWTTKR